MFQVDAFTQRIFAGNPAAVLVLEDWLPDRTLQAVALENNLSETAFLRPSGAGWDLRWFTPLHEVAFCGHATLASAHVLASELGVDGELVFATRVGELRVKAEAGLYRMDLPRFDPEVGVALPEGLAGLFAGQALAAFRNFENLFVELPSEAALRAFVPDLPAIADLSGQGLAVTAPGEAVDFVSRYFAPAAGIAEDPVTGSTHATLVPYWAEKLGKSTLSARQCSTRGGDLSCELAGDRVLISGHAVTFMRAEIDLPDIV
ncbi:MAG: PhzF family phenazine biosynthesis protein [Rhodospirillales bacterium]